MANARRSRRRSTIEGETDRLRVLVVSKLILWRRDEGSELWEQVAGLVEANSAGEVDILVTDGLTVYKPRVQARQMSLERKGSIVASWWHGADIVHIHHLLPIARHFL